VTCGNEIKLAYQVLKDMDKPICPLPTEERLRRNKIQHGKPGKSAHIRHNIPPQGTNILVILNFIIEAFF
jgi:hypothetical protein